tara:strand:+ start:2013 stop:2636 length:624 start_codon:yes stop_codon:yes gene_type:complete
MKTFNITRNVIIKTPMDIPGETQSLQHEWYKRVRSWHADSANILEIGCAFGRSTWGWLDVMDKTNDRLDVVDTLTYPDYRFNTHSNSKQILKDIKEYSQEDIFYYTVGQHKNYNKITNLHNMTSFKFMKKFKDKTYDIVFLDGSHDYKTVNRELNNFKGARVICGDDFSYEHHDVINAVTDFYKANNNYYLYTDTAARFWALRNGSA